VNGVGILRGVEANIKANGETDCTAKMHAALDLIIAGFHKQVFAPADVITNTDALIAVIASGKVHIISHPGNRSTRLTFPPWLRPQRPATWRWKSITPHLCIHAKAAKPTALKLSLRWAKPGADFTGNRFHSVFSLGDFSACQNIIDAGCTDHILNVSPGECSRFWSITGRKNRGDLRGVGLRTLQRRFATLPLTVYCGRPALTMR
jgi:putative hydrolase